MKTKKLFFFGLIIFVGSVLFSNNIVAAADCTGKNKGDACTLGSQNGICTDVGEGAALGCVPGASATGTPAAGGTGEFVNPLRFTTVSEIIGAVLGNLQGIIALIAVIMIVIGGIMYMLSAGNTDMIERAKKTWTAAIIGLAIALAAPTFLKTLKDVLGGPGGANPDAVVNQALTLKQIAVKVLDFLLSVAGFIGIIGLVVGGMFYLTAYGNEEQIDKGKGIITASLIGIVIILASVIIVRQLASLMGALP